MISDKEMRKRIADMSPQELLKASETFEALFDLVHQHDDNSIAITNPDVSMTQDVLTDIYLKLRLIKERMEKIMEKSSNGMISKLLFSLSVFFFISLMF